VVIHLLDVHPEGVDGKDCKFLVLLSVVNEVEIDHLLHDNILSAGGLDHLWVKPGNINTESHVGNDLLDDVSLLVDVFLNAYCSQECPKLIDLTLLMVHEELRGWEACWGRLRCHINCTSQTYLLLYLINSI